MPTVLQASLTPCPSGMSFIRYCSVHPSTQLPRPPAYIKNYDHIFSFPLFLKGLKAVVDSPLTEVEKKDSLLGLYWAAQMATSTASSACSTRSPVCLLQQKLWIIGVTFPPLSQAETLLLHRDVFCKQLDEHSQICRRSTFPVQSGKFRHVHQKPARSCSEGRYSHLHQSVHFFTLTRSSHLFCLACHIIGGW